MRGLTAVVLGAVCACGSKSSTPDAVTDSRPIDAVIDAVPIQTMPATCQVIHDRDKNMPSGKYMIDPDGPGGQDPLEVFCDMVTDGGGWTQIFLAPNLTLNHSAGPIPYTSSTSTLLHNVQTALIGFRDANGAIAANYAEFAFPANWRNDTPFDFSNVDEPVLFKLNGAAPISGTLKYGYGNFQTPLLCADIWLASGAYGRLCIAVSPAVPAPQFTGFGGPYPNSCTDSDRAYNAAPCTADKLFSIAAR